MIVDRQEQECDSARNLDEGKERTEAKQQINGEDVHDQLVKVKSEICGRYQRRTTEFATGKQRPSKTT